METNGRQRGPDRVEDILSTLGADELELDDPPPAVWSAIESALTPDDPSADTFGAAGTVVEYSIGPDDVVHDTGADWDRFAEENGAPEMTVLDRSRSLWSYMNSDRVREPWQLLVQRVRDRHASAKVTFRCDAPHARRWFELVVTPREDGSVRFRTTQLFEEPRDPISLLDPAIDRDPTAVPVELCAWCGRGRSGDRWLDIETLLTVDRLLEQVPPPPLAYGICGSCQRTVAADLLVGGTSTDT